MEALAALLPRLIAYAPQVIALMNDPAVKALLPLLQQLGSSVFPTADPAKATQAAGALFDTNATKWVQTALNFAGYGPLDVDGVYGQATKDAVTKFQQANNLTADGWSGQVTNDALRGALHK